MKKTAASKKSSRSTRSTKSKRPEKPGAYYWRSGSRFTVDPQLAGERVSQLREAHGREVEAEDILREAEDPGSPLHDPLFHFGDDTKAALQYRADMARRMVTSLVFNIVMAEGADPVQMPAFVNTSPAGGRAQFDHTLVAFRAEDARNRVVDSAWRQFEAMRKKFEHLSELRAIFEAIDKTRPPASKTEARA